MESQTIEKYTQAIKDLAISKSKLSWLWSHKDNHSGIILTEMMNYARKINICGGPIEHFGKIEGIILENFFEKGGKINSILTEGQEKEYPNSLLSKYSNSEYKDQIKLIGPIKEKLLFLLKNTYFITTDLNSFMLEVPKSQIENYIIDRFASFKDELLVKKLNKSFTINWDTFSFESMLD